MLEPTGQGNPPPIFLSRNVAVLYQRAVGQSGAHLQLRLASDNGGGSGRPIQAIAFRQGAWTDMLPDRIDIIYTLGVNDWNGQRDLQLVVKDIQPVSG
jgi:single-stranded-DNA-specific exonuclease